MARNICAPEVALYRRRTQALGRAYVIVIFQPPTCRRVCLRAHCAMTCYAARYIRKGDIWYSGVDAFIHLWAEVPGFNWLARLVGLPPVRMIAVPVYDHVLAPWLYRRHLRRAACAVS